MFRLIEELLLQLLIEQIATLLGRLIEWFNTMPWQVWFA